MIELRPYQVRAAEALVRCQRGIVKSPAGSGKTIIGAAALDLWLRDYRDERALLFRRLERFPLVVWVANTIEQCQQAREALAAFPEIARRARIEVACYAAAPDCRQAVLVIADECHHVASPEYRKCIEGCPGWRWGLSATPERADDLAADVYALLGPIVCVIDRAELVESGKLAKARVQFHAPNAQGEFQRVIAAEAEPLIQQRIQHWRRVPEDEIRKRTLWFICQKIGIYENAKRNARILEVAREYDGESTIILVGTVEHGRWLAERLSGAVVAHSKMGVRARRETMGAFRNGTLRCLIGTSLLDEGFDAPCARVLIVTSGGRSSRKAEQTSGRVLRPFADKAHGLIHDLWDWQHYFLLAQSKARRRVYEGLGYDVACDFGSVGRDSETPTLTAFDGQPLMGAQRAALPQAAPY